MYTYIYIYIGIIWEVMIMFCAIMTTVVCVIVLISTAFNDGRRGMTGANYDDSHAISPTNMGKQTWAKPSRKG